MRNRSRARDPRERGRRRDDRSTIRHDFGTILYQIGRGRGGWRLDHIIGSEAFVPVACEYEHGPRERGLSDHSPMWVEVTRD